MMNMNLAPSNLWAGAQTRAGQGSAALSSAADSGSNPVFPGSRSRSKRSMSPACRKKILI
jgi:hypothetical protein